jgi:hypothetical protein
MCDMSYVALFVCHHCEMCFRSSLDWFVDLSVWKLRLSYVYSSDILNKSLDCYTTNKLVLIKQELDR